MSLGDASKIEMRDMKTAGKEGMTGMRVVKVCVLFKEDGDNTRSSKSLRTSYRYPRHDSLPPAQDQEFIFMEDGAKVQTGSALHKEIRGFN